MTEGWEDIVSLVEGGIADAASVADVVYVDPQKVAVAKSAATDWLSARRDFDKCEGEVKGAALAVRAAQTVVDSFGAGEIKKPDDRYGPWRDAKRDLKQASRALDKARERVKKAGAAARKAEDAFRAAFAATGLEKIADLARAGGGAQASDDVDDDGEAPPPEPQDRGYDVEGLNSEFALVLMGSKAVVVREQPTAQVEDRIRILSLEAFAAYFANRFSTIFAADGKFKTIAWGKRWLADRRRRTFDGIEFHPDPKNEGGQKNHLNLWRGFSVVPRANAGTYAIFRDHLLTNVCNGDAELYAWLFGWFAHMMQRPRERIGTALVFRGGMGTGKTKVGEVFGSLIDNHYFLVDDPRYITGQFNAHMASCLLLQAEEAVWAGDKTAEGRLKSLITSSIQMIEAKGIDPIRVTNYVRLVMTSNEDWVVPAGKDERRFAIVDVADTVKENFDYFRDMDEQLAAGGREALLHDLLHFDLSTVELRKIPKTEPLLEQKIRSLGHVETWWFERLMAGTQRAHTTYWFEEVAKDLLVSDYLGHAEKIGIRRRSGEVEVGMKLKRLVPGLGEARRWVDVPDDHGNTHRAQKRCWVFPPLDDCREAFAATLQQHVAWPTDHVFEQQGAPDG